MDGVKQRNANQNLRSVNRDYSLFIAELFRECEQNQNFRYIYRYIELQC